MLLLAGMDTRVPLEMATGGERLLTSRTEMRTLRGGRARHVWWRRGLGRVVQAAGTRGGGWDITTLASRDMQCFYIGVNTRAALYGSFAHDLDLPSVVCKKSVSPKYWIRSLRLAYCHRCVGLLSHQQSRGQVGKPVTDLPLSKFVEVRRSPRGWGTSLVHLLSPTPPPVSGIQHLERWSVDKVVSLSLSPRRE